MISVNRFGADIELDEETYESFKEKLDSAELTQDPAQIQELKEGLFEFYAVLNEAMPKVDLGENDIVKFDALTYIRLRDTVMIELYLKEKNLFYDT